MQLSGRLSVALLLVAAAVAFPQAGRPERFPTFPEFKCNSGMAYCNRAIEAGIHTEKLYGRGAAFVDLDGDGWDDLFLANTDDGWDPKNRGVSMFYINQRNGKFTPKTAMDMGIDSRDLVATWSGSFADYDNDGDPDLLLANGGYTGKSNVALYENRIKDGAGFVSATTRSGIGALNSLPSTWWGSSWADYDRDGWLDVVVTRTVGTVAVFHNNGNGTFTQLSSLLGVNIVMRDGKNPVWIDYNMDGYPDLYLAGMRDHAFYRNVEGKRFVNVTDEIFPTPLPLLEGWRFAIEPIVFAAMVSDFNQDGLDDLYLGRWSLQAVLLINNGKGGFTRHTTDWGLITSLEDRPETGAPFENAMGLTVGDLFDDGFPDVVLGTGNPQRAAPDIVFCNKRGETFERRERGAPREDVGHVHVDRLESGAIKSRAHLDRQNPKATPTRPPLDPLTVDPT